MKFAETLFKRQKSIAYLSVLLYVLLSSKELFECIAIGIRCSIFPRNNAPIQNARLTKAWIVGFKIQFF